MANSQSDLEVPRGEFADPLVNENLVPPDQQDKEQPTVVHQEMALQKTEGDRELNIAIPVNLQQVIQNMRSDVQMDITVNETTVVGNKNTIVQRNDEEIRNAIEASGTQMTDEHKDQTTRISQEIQGSERRLTKVIGDEGSQIVDTITNTGQDVSDRIDQTTERTHEYMAHGQDNMELHIAKVKDLSAALYRDTAESALDTTAKSIEAQNQLQQALTESTATISKETVELKSDVRNTEKNILGAVGKQLTPLQNEMGIMKRTLHEQTMCSQKIKADLVESRKEMHQLTEYIHATKKDTIEDIGSLHRTVDNLTHHQTNFALESHAFQQTVTDQLAQIQNSIKMSNKSHQKALNKMSEKLCGLEGKLNEMDETMETLALETTVHEGTRRTIGTVLNTVNRSERRLDALIRWE